MPIWEHANKKVATAVARATGIKMDRMKITNFGSQKLSMAVDMHE